MITGAAGFIGHHLVKNIENEKFLINGLDDARTGDWDQVSDIAQVHEMSMEKLSFADYCDLLEDTQTLFHLAAEKYNSSRMTPESVFDVNIRSTDLLFRAAVHVGVHRIVFTSSLYAYGNLGPKKMSELDVPLPRTHYGVSKLAGEHLLRTACLDSKTTWNIARLLFIYGPEQFAEGGYKSVIITNFERLLQGKRPLIKGDGNQILDYVYVGDCIESLRVLSESPLTGQTVNVASGKPVSVLELVRRMCKIAGVDFNPKFIDEDWTAGTFRVGENGHMLDVFGWSPNEELNVGLKRTWDWMNSIGAKNL